MMIAPFCRVISAFALTLCIFLLSANIGLCAEKPQAAASPDSEKIKAVIKTLETPAEREALISALKIMAEAQQPKLQDKELKSAAAELLRDISSRVDGVTESIVAITGTVNEFPEIIAWFSSELSESDSRRMWTEVGYNIILTLGFGYFAFYLIRLGLARLRKKVCCSEPQKLIHRLPGLLGLLIIDVLPIVFFAIAAYVTLGIVGPREQTRLVALAWVNAFIISHAIGAVLIFLLAPQATHLRLFKLADDNANYLVIWGKRLTYSSIYGYFALQAALLLGLATGPYDAMLRILGLFVSVLLVIMIMQNRETVGEYILRQSHDKKPEDKAEITTDGSPETPQRGSRGLRKRLAKTWHLLALLYVILLYGVWALRIPGGFFFLFRATVLTMVVVFAIKAVLGMITSFFARGFQINDELKTRFPGLEKRANQYIATLHTGVRLCVYFLGSISIFQAWGIDTYDWITSEPGKVLGGTVASVAGILVVSFIVWEITNSLIQKRLAPIDEDGTPRAVNPRTLTLLTVARKALAIVLIIFSSLMILAEVGVNIAPLLAGAGVLGLAIGFGSQKLVQDVITGVFILLEDQIAVGDVVNLGGLAGVVEAVSIRTVRLRDATGTVHTIPFSAISTVSNRTKDFSYCVMDVGIGYRESVDEVMKVLKEIGAELQDNPEYGEQILEPIEVLGVDAFADSAVIIRARIKTVPTKQWWVGREFNRLMKNKFDELDIEIPFPHQTLYFGVDKKGDAPSANVSIRS